MTDPELLDRPVGAEEYIIGAAAEGTNPDPLIDLSLIDFDGLAAKFAGWRRAETDRLAQLLRQQAIGVALRNPTRYELVECIEQLIEDYNAGSVNIDEYLRRLIELSQTLTAEEERAVREGMPEEELAIFDPLTQPDPVVTAEERETVQGEREATTGTPARGACAGLAAESCHYERHLQHDPSRPRSEHARGAVHRGHLPHEIFHTKVQLVFDHVLAAYGDNGESVYAPRVDYVYPRHGVVLEYPGPIDVNKVADDVVARIHSDPTFAAHKAEQLKTRPTRPGRSE